MTVAQLIAKLQTLPQNLEVVTSDELEDGYNFQAADAVVVSTVHENDCPTVDGEDGTCFCNELGKDPNGDMVAIIPDWE